MAYGNLPLFFEANTGQTDSRVRFLARGGDYNLFLTSTEAVLALRGRSSPARRPDPLGFALSAKTQSPRKASGAVLRMEFAGANPASRVEGVDQLPGKANSFNGKDPKRWRTNVPTYRKVRYHDVYPGVDLVYYGNQRRLEYDFVVASGVDPRGIRLAFAGADSLEVDSEGDLVARVGAREVRLRKPLCYQEVEGARREIAGRYVLAGKREVTFEMAAYDMKRPLVIDPALVYSTYLGGATQDLATDIAVDAAGSAYVTGTTSSADFPAAAGAFDTTFGGALDAFVAKLNSAGTALLYSTYLGGGALEFGLGIAVDADGNAYVTGETGSADFPTTPGAFGTTFNNGVEAFVTKLNASGSALLYSTFLGGSGSHAGLGIAVDSDHNAYVTGQTSSGVFPTTPGAFQSVFGGGFFDGFVTKLNSSGSALIYSTYLGGSGDDFGGDLAVDIAGNAYVTGTTGSANFPATPGAFQTAFGGADFDVFATKLNTSGSGLIYSTYLGGAGSDFSGGLALDAAGDAYVMGHTGSANFPTTPGALSPVLHGVADIFVTRLDASGSALVYSTYLGGGGDETGGGIAIDSHGNAFLTGSTSSTDFPTTPGAIQTSFGGGFDDAFMTKLNASGSALLYSTYLGGGPSIFAGESGRGIAVDSLGDAYVTGSTDAPDFPTTPGALQTAFAGGFADAFVTRISPGAVDFFLHATSTNPPVFFLDLSAPATAASKFADSTTVRFADGNVFQRVGTWAAAPPLSAGTLARLQDLHVFLGLKNSDDVGTRFDLRAEVLKNGAVVASGLTRCIAGLARDPGAAREVAVAFAPFAPVSFNGTTDVLSLRVLTRIGTTGSDAPCGGHVGAVGLRLYFDAVSRESRFGGVFGP